MILALLTTLSLMAHADITVERDQENGEVNQEGCAGGCFKQVTTTKLTNNRWNERQAIANIMSEGGAPISFSNTEGAAVREK